jgi:enoyl-CoA hydratase/carnithine racemase
MATMCVINGHAFAGGLFIALAHDFRIMTTNPKVLMCLSEINIGIPFPAPLSVFLRSLLSAQTVR